jgi:4-hydroxy-2-oxoheptanedioate aldolase
LVIGLAQLPRMAALGSTVARSCEGVGKVETFLKESSRAGQPALGLWCTVSDTLVAEVLASVGPDYVCIDTQHGKAHERNLVAMIQAVDAGGSVPIVRVGANQPAAIGKALDAGARGVVIPLVESGEQAARAVQACRFPPFGIRSFGPFRSAMHAGTSDPRELEKVACVVMIETRAGVAHLDEIVATEGITAVYVGPADLSLALGLRPASIEDPKFVSTLEEIRTACAARQVVVGIHCISGAMARQAVEQGFGMVTVAPGELGPMRAALLANLTEARSAILTGQAEDSNSP